MTDSQEVQRGEPQNLSGSPRAEGRPPFAMAGGDGIAPAGSSPTRQNVPIVAAPAVTDEQRQRLRRAIEAYRSESA